MGKGARGIAIILVLLTASAGSWGAEWHVKTTGSAGGNGSDANPWTLAVALAQPAAVQPGDTIWVHQGTYTGTFSVALAGTASAPINVVRIMNRDKRFIRYAAPFADIKFFLQ